MEQSITQESEKYIRALFEKEIQENLHYHDILHTEYVARQAGIIGQNSGLSPEEINIVTVAAWFHDSGFVSKSDGHEEVSQEIARKFLRSKEMPEAFIEKALVCIEATRMPQNPGDDLLAQVLCDADMAYLSEDFYLDRTVLLRKEWNHGSETKLSKNAYYQETVELFKNHRYYTEYGQNTYSAGKERNFLLLHTLREKKPKKGKKKSSKPSSKNTKALKKSEKDKMPGRGVESMLRLTARNQINLSSIADNKANILISINSIVLTVLVSIGIGKISDYPVITFPAIVFIITCLSTIIFAILSTRPKISSGKFTKEDIHNRRVNLLFFGNFYKMEMEEYEWAMKEMMTDTDYLYSSMIRDQYNLGKVISQKYRLLRIAYTVFMIGIILSSLLFAVFILFVPG
jgi:predicted metal-dependent HD superfamily phosphohydrolase